MAGDLVAKVRWPSTGVGAKGRIIPSAAKEPNKKNGDGAGTAVITRTRTQTKRPSMYRVLLLNDDYTPMEFVVAVLAHALQQGAG